MSPFRPANFFLRNQLSTSLIFIFAGGDSLRVRFISQFGSFNPRLNQACGDSTPTEGEEAELNTVFDETEAESQVWVIGTDYNYWAAVYHCTEVDGEAVESGFVLTRFRDAAITDVSNVSALGCRETRQKSTRMYFYGPR